MPKKENLLKNGSTMDMMHYLLHFKQVLISGVKNFIF